jgi:hypothetical protein
MQAKRSWRRLALRDNGALWEHTLRKLSGFKGEVRHETDAEVALPGTLFSVSPALDFKLHRITFQETC